MDKGVPYQMSSDLTSHWQSLHTGQWQPLPNKQTDKCM
jgi:hypothetical protein